MSDVETGWLIELQTNDGAKWWTGVPGPDGLIFSKDSFLAVRFARRQDAEKVIEAFRRYDEDQFWDEAYATDHMWIG